MGTIKFALGLSVCISVSAIGCSAAAFASEPYRVYVSNEEAGTISVIDGVTRGVIQTIIVGKRPRGIRVSPDGRLLYAALSGSPIAGPKSDEKVLPAADKTADGIGVIDISDGKLVRVIRGVSDPEQVAIAPDGRTLYVVSEDTGKAVVFDAETGKEKASIDIGGEPEGVRVSPDGRLVLVTSEADNSVALIDPVSNTLVAKIATGERPRDVLFTSDSKFAFVSGEADGTVTLIDVAARRVLSKVRIDGDSIRPMGLALSNDGTRLYVSTGRGKSVAMLDSRTLATLKMAHAGARPWGIALSPDGVIYTANGPSNDVSVLDAMTLQAIATIPVGERPWGVAIAAVR